MKKLTTFNLLFGLLGLGSLIFLLIAAADNPVIRLSQLDPAGANDGDVLTYFAPSQTWYHKAPTGGGGSGNGFPLTSNANAATFSITNLASLVGSNGATANFTGTGLVYSNNNGTMTVNSGLLQLTNTATGASFNSPTNPPTANQVVMTTDTAGDTAYKNVSSVQTPWLLTINGNQQQLTNVSQIIINGTNGAQGITIIDGNGIHFYSGSYAYFTIGTNFITFSESNKLAQIQGYLQFPSPGYAALGSTGYVWQSTFFGNSANTNLAYTWNVANSTNTDGSINTVFRRGVNQSPNGVTVAGLGDWVEQFENNYVTAGFPYFEHHFIVSSTNGVEQRYITTQITKTNGYTRTQIGADSFQLTSSTNAGSSAIQITYDNRAPLLQGALISMNNQSLLNWSSTNLNAPTLEGVDGGNNTRVWMQWSAAGGGTGHGVFYLNPNNDWDHLEVSGPYTSFTGGGINVGAVGSPGAGNVSATAGLATHYNNQASLLSSNVATGTWSFTNSDVVNWQCFIGGAGACAVQGVSVNDSQLFVGNSTNILTSVILQPQEWLRITNTTAPVFHFKRF